MNNPENSKITSVTPEDVELIEKELTQSSHPISLHALSEKLAFQKTAGQRMQDVKKYDPDARYEPGDFILKDYDETLAIGSKNVEHFKGTVILKVVGKVFYKTFNCEMLEVDYAGGGVFRKYIDYMKKTKTQVLLPSNLEGRNKAAEIIEKGSDPRLTELPMAERDLKSLEKNLRAALIKSPRLFNWNDQWQMEEKRIEIPDDKIKEITGFFETSGGSESTEALIQKFMGIDASRDLFEIHCLSLNYSLEKKFKKDFIQMSPAGWGKWHLKKILNALPEGLPLSAPMAKPAELEPLEKPEMSIVQDFPIKVYLTWREILSGGIKIPRSLGKTLSHAREYTFTDPEEGKNYTLFYYPASNYFLGLQDFYVQHNIPQGTSLTLEKKGPAHFHFWIKKSKKKASVLKLSYDAKEDKFSDSGEEAFTFAEPNKIIYIDRDVLSGLLPLYAQREGLDLKEMLILVFKSTARSSAGNALHFLRAYHLVDILKQTTQEDVEFTLLNCSDFTKSEKKKGIFYYQEPYTQAEEFAIAESSEEAAAPAGGFVEREPGESYLPPGTVGFGDEEEEEFFPEGPPEIIDLSPPVKAKVPVPEVIEKEAAAPVVAPAKEKPSAAPAKKEKPHKKKKAKLEAEKGLRPKKSERRVIEEKIVEEESEMEAMAALKQKEEKLEEQRMRAAKEKKEEIKPSAKEETKFGLFGDLLKSALTQKKKEGPPDQDQKKEKS